MTTIEAVRAVLDQANALQLGEMKAELRRLRYQRQIIDEKITAVDSKLNNHIAIAMRQGIDGCSAGSAD